MKCLLVIEQDDTRESILEHLAPMGFDFIHYRNPVKAMDNLEEIGPELLIFSAVDFPRHWKPCITLLRSIKSKEESVFILLKGMNFPQEESIKASSLDVNGIVSEDFSDPVVLSQLEDVFTRYNVINDKRLNRRYLKIASKEIEFIFTNPGNSSLITGDITDISLGGLSFKPDMPFSTQDIREGTVLNNCTLRLGDSFYTISVNVVRNNNILSLSFLDLGEGIKEDLMEYFHRIPERELEKVLHPGG